jgi:hypothetical protein
VLTVVEVESTISSTGSPRSVRAERVGEKAQRSGARVVLEQLAANARKVAVLERIPMLEDPRRTSGHD